MSDLKIYNKENIAGFQNYDTIDGCFLCQSVIQKVTRNGKPYFEGNLYAQGTIGFKVWDNSGAFPKLKAEDYTGIVVLVKGSIQSYQGTNSVIITDIFALDMDTSPFLEKLYDSEAYYSCLHALVYHGTSDNGKKLADLFLFEDEEVRERFKLEFAACSMHDNCLSGLLAHTYKVCSLVSTVITMYPDLIKTQEEKDLLIISALIHDRFKILEYKMGTITKFITYGHITLCMDYLASKKQDIIALYSEDWYYNLLTCISQHHGEYSEKPTTVYSAVLHMCDIFDARMTSIKEGVRTGLVETNQGKRFKDINFGYLSVM